MSGLQALAVTVVLVHGGFVDGAGWEGVYNVLKKDGYNVSVVQNPTTSLADDVAATRLAIARAQGPIVLVGHSYGGVVITEAGRDPKVAGLVYVAGFAPDREADPAQHGSGEPRTALGRAHAGRRRRSRNLARQAWDRRRRRTSGETLTLKVKALS